MKEIKAIVQRFMVDKVIDSLHEHPHLPGVTVSEVRGFRRSGPDEGPSRRNENGPMSKIELVVPDDATELVLRLIATAAHTGNSGDGKIFVYEVADVLKIRTGERGEVAI